MEKDYGQKLSFKYEVNAEGKKKSLYTFPLILKKDGLVQSYSYILVTCT